MLMVDLIQKIARKLWYPEQISLQTDKISKFTNHPLSQTNINREINITSITFPLAFKRWTGRSPHNFRCHKLNKNIG